MSEQINDATTGSSFTANPRAPKDNTRYEEKPGEITSDSLAAESINSGGSCNSGHSAAGNTPSGSTTANTSDTSAARVLAPAVDAAHRDDSDSASASAGTSTSSSSGGNTSTATSEKPDNNTNTAPSYASAAGPTDENAKPKGTNITEGGFDSGAPNASFNNEIGTENDPGRAAELEFEKSNARVGGAGGYEGANAPGSTDKGQYGALKDESA